ncbi:formate/nitrite transporter family protein [Arcanobacterium hippocoleae]|uniref:formate/nitrite transporter family protein n=1 Tax=Arcanobacterium hippocoleae TaxID=149017 RepID=UPI00333FE69A
MLDLHTTLYAQMQSGQHKADEMRTPLKFLIATILAGLYIGIADIYMMTAAGPFFAADSPATMLVAGLVFGIGLVLVVFAGANLLTSAMMALPHAAAGKMITWRRAWLAMILIFFGNLIGSVIFAYLMAHSGIFDDGTAAREMLDYLVHSKTAKPTLALFIRGIFCNVLVCGGIWMASRTKNDCAKILILVLSIATFISAGFEHVVANMTTISLGMFLSIPDATFGGFAWNLLWVGLGNLVGGMLIVGGSYYVYAAPAKAPAAEMSDVH